MCPTPLHPGVGQPCPRGNGESLGSGIDTDTSLIIVWWGHVWKH